MKTVYLALLALGVLITCSFNSSRETQSKPYLFSDWHRRNQPCEGPMSVMAMLQQLRSEIISASTARMHFVPELIHV